MLPWGKSRLAGDENRFFAAQLSDQIPPAAPWPCELARVPPGRSLVAVPSYYAFRPRCRFRRCVALSQVRAAGDSHATILATNVEKRIVYPLACVFRVVMEAGSPEKCLFCVLFRDRAVIERPVFDPSNALSVLLLPQLNSRSCERFLGFFRSKRILIRIEADLDSSLFGARLPAPSQRARSVTRPNVDFLSKRTHVVVFLSPPRV